MEYLQWWIILTVLSDISRSSSHIEKENEVVDVYVSKRNGNDTLSCGPVSSPCHTIAMGVWRARENARVHIDGTGSETTPYACKSSSLELTGIQANKSLEMIGFQEMVHVKCQEGYGIRFQKSDQVETVVSLTNIKFTETNIQAKDVNIFINHCIFADGKQGISLVQSTRPTTMLFTGSLCVNTSSCIIVNVTVQVQPTNKISIGFKDSNIVSSRLIDSPGIHVTSTGEYNPGSITCDITLYNVTFKQNVLGVKGLIFIDLMNAFTMLDFDTVFFEDNKVETYSINLITVQDSVNHVMNLANMKVAGNCDGFCRALSLDIKNQSTLNVINSSFEQFNVGTQSGVINLYSKNCSMYVHNTSFTSNNGEMGNGGCISVNGGKARVLIEDSYFTNNTGKNGGALWISTKDYLLTNITNCHFKSNSAAASGGVASLESKEVHIIMTGLTITDSNAEEYGGSFMIGNATEFDDSMPTIHNAIVQIKNLNVLRSACNNNGGGVFALKAKGGLISIHDSVTEHTKAAAGGVAVISSFPLQQMGFSFKVYNTTFNFSAANNSGSTIWAYGVHTLTMESIVVDNSYGPEWYLGSLSFFDSTPISTTSYVNANFTINKIKIRKSKEKILSTGLLIYYYTTPLSLTLTNSVFESKTPYSLGCLTLTSPDTDIVIRNVTFKGSYPLYNGVAGVFINANKANAVIDSCQFNDNVGGDGGAVKFSYMNVKGDQCTESAHGFSQNSYSSARNCFFSSKIPQKKLAYNISILIKNTTFTNNTATAGGALSLTGGNITIIGCYFIDNFAKIQGGHIYTTLDSTSVQIYDSIFTQTGSTRTVIDNFGKREIYSLSNGLFLHWQSSGPLVILNTTFESKLSHAKHVGLQTLFSVSKLKSIDFGENNQTTVICPRGSYVDIINYTNVIASTDTIAVLLWEMNCKPCEIDTYSLQRGRSLGENRVSGFQCLSCPFGAECHGKITAKPNFWGYIVQQNPPKLNFTLCPLRYCNTKHRDNFINYNSCQGNRTGTLCGQCKKYHSETLLSPSCCHDDECHDNWLWGVAIAMATLMALYLIHKPDLAGILKKQIVWFKCQRNEEDDQHEAQKHDGGGYLKIVFYFYQAVNILLVTNSYEKVIQSNLLHPVVGIFNFQFRFSLKGFLCPFPGLTAVTKQFLFASQVFGVLFMILVCYCCHCILHKCRSTQPPNLGPYLGAILETLLLGYTVFANTSLQMLRCTSLGDEFRLFIAGQVACYQWWQYLLMVFVGVVVFPLILTLAFGSHWLYNGTISVKEFFLGCVLPLPFLVYKLISFMFRLHRPKEEPSERKRAITKVLYGPFRTPQGNISGAVYWESILISRRLLLIIIYAFVTDSLSKELLLVLACVVILLHHHSVQPFRDSAANNAETVSLFGLFIIATMNTLKASFLSFGQAQKGPLKSLEDVFDWVQIIIITALPILCIVAVLGATVSQVIRLIVKAVSLLKIKCMKSKDESQGLLIPGPLDEFDQVQR